MQIGITPIPTIISGPDGTVCVNPAVFHELVAFDDALRLAALCLFFGIGLVLGLQWLYKYLDEKEDEE